jgi:hypothetical protein
MKRFGEAAMTFTFARTMLACAALALSATAATASKPIPGVDVIVRKNPGGHLIVHTDRSGRASLGRLDPGDYTLTIGGETLVAAMDRIAALAKKNGGAVLPSSRAAIGVGDLNGDGVPDRARRGGPGIQIVLDLGPAGRILKTAPYRRDQAREGVTIAFTIPNRGGVRPGHPIPAATLTVNAISDQASAGNLTSY